MSDYSGPRIGDRVAVEVRGDVVEMQARDGVPGVLVDLDEDGGTAWAPLDVAVLLST